MSPSRRDFIALLAGGTASLAAPPLPLAADPLNEHDHSVALRARLVALRNDARESWDRLLGEDILDDEEGQMAHLVMALDTAIMATCPHSRDLYQESEFFQDVICCPLCEAEGELSPWGLDWKHADGRICYIA